MFSVDGVAGFVPGVVAIPVDVLPTSLSVHGDWTTRLADLRPYRERNPLRAPVPLGLPPMQAWPEEEGTECAQILWDGDYKQFRLYPRGPNLRLVPVG